MSTTDVKPESAEYAVFGRIPEQDDVVTIVKASSKEDAIEVFTDEIYLNEPDDERARVENAHGLPVFVTAVVRGTAMEEV